MVALREIRFDENNQSKKALIEALNYYSCNCGPTESKAWALEWIRKNLPEDYNRLNSKKETVFSNRGFVCRIHDLGYNLSEEQILSLKKFFKNIPTKDNHIGYLNPISEEEKPTKTEKINTLLQNIDLMIDSILSDEEPLSVSIPTDNKMISEAIPVLEKLLIEEQEQIMKHTLILQTLEQIFIRCGGVSNKLTELSNTPRTRRTRQITKNTKTLKSATVQKIIDTVKYQKSDPALGESIVPTKILGAKQVLIYNTKYKTTTLYIANINSGFSFSGSSLRGFDETKCVGKYIKSDIVEFWKTTKISNFVEKTATFRDTPIRSLFSEHTFIIDVLK